MEKYIRSYRDRFTLDTKSQDPEVFMLDRVGYKAEETSENDGVFQFSPSRIALVNFLKDKIGSRFEKSNKELQSTHSIGDLADYRQELYELCQETGYDFSLVDEDINFRDLLVENPLTVLELKKSELIDLDENEVQIQLSFDKDNQMYKFQKIKQAIHLYLRGFSDSEIEETVFVDQKSNQFDDIPNKKHFAMIKQEHRALCREYLMAKLNNIEMDQTSKLRIKERFDTTTLTFEYLQKLILGLKVYLRKSLEIFNEKKHEINDKEFINSTQQLRAVTELFARKSSLSEAKYRANKRVGHLNDWLSQQMLNNPGLVDKVLTYVIEKDWHASSAEKALVSNQLIINLQRDMRKLQSRFRKAVKALLYKDYFDWSEVEEKIKQQSQGETP